MADGDQVRKAVKGRRAFDVVRHQILAELADGTLKPGDKLPAEREFAEKLGFSRAAVREALRGLEATGIVQLHKGVTGGAFIQGGDKVLVSRSISDLILLGNVPLRQVMEMRSLLLMHAVRLACERATDFEALEANIERTSAEAEDLEATFFNVGEFYSIIGKYAGNEVLAMLINSLTNITSTHFRALGIEFTYEVVILRRAVLKRLKERDEEGSARAIAENIAFLHGFVIARAAAHEGG